MIITGLKLGDKRVIIANVPALGHKFDHWSGDTASLDSSIITPATVTMPNNDIELIANYVPNYTNTKYGYLYNLYAVQNVKNMANTGWHVTHASADINGLITYLGGNSVAGGKLKEVGTTHWDAPNTGATNEVGFNLRGSGCRDSTGAFTGLNRGYNVACQDGAGGSWYTPYAVYDSVSMGLTNTYPAKYGYPVRLVKDDSTDSGFYIGNDGKVYRTIKIGTQVWLAQDLMETKYRDGSTIPVVTDNTAWSVLTTDARCVYNNDESNA